MGPTDSSAKMNNDRGVFIAISCEGLHQRARIYQLGLWLAIFFAIFLRLPPNKFLRIPPDLSPVSIRLALLFLLLRAPSWPGVFRSGWLCYFCYYGHRVGPACFDPVGFAIFATTGTELARRILLAFLGMELRLAGHPSAIAPAWDIVRATFALVFALGRCLHAHFSHAAMERSWLF